MKCDRCDNEATVHEVNIIDGQKTEVHLCQECAQELGIVAKPTTNISELLTKMVTNPASAGRSSSAAAPVCESCGTTFARIRKTGLLGCSDCYRVFEQELNSLLERAHEGGTHHIGKIPRRAGGEIDQQYQILRLRKQLQEAISAEEYERAANLRDRLRTTENVEKDAPARQPRQAVESDPAEDDPA
ncbi:MAG: UvrB/UvrC motif-containing protein [Phycisphaerales bacterium]|nr:UvrB/UvrC motif-containing protein [Phycisphaerales bacterium]